MADGRSPEGGFSAKVNTAKRVVQRGVMAATMIVSAKGATHMQSPRQEVVGDTKAVVDTAQNISKTFDEALGKLMSGLESPQYQSSGVKVESAEGQQSVQKVIDIFYPGISDTDRKELANQIAVTKEYMKGILTPQSYQNIKDHEQLFDDLEKYAGLKKDVSIGLVLAESRGGVDGNDPNADGALGPAQLTLEKAKEYGLNDQERLDWNRSLSVFAMDMAEKRVYFAGNDGLAVWSWHMGENGVKEQIENYSADKAQGFTDLQKYIHDNHITVFSILQVKNIREDLEKPGYDSTPLYVLRIAASAALYDDLQTLAKNEIKNSN